MTTAGGATATALQTATFSDLSHLPTSQSRKPEHVFSYHVVGSATFKKLLSVVPFKFAVPGKQR